MSEHKKSVEAAIAKYIQRQEDKNKPKATTKKQGKPEKLVEHDCLRWMRAQGWSVDVFEAKAQWDGEKFRSAGMKYGTCDIMGTTDEGMMVAVELKAAGKLSSFNREGNFKQREFIITKIGMGCFACVVDSAELLASTYAGWLAARDDAGKSGGIAFLTACLPQKRAVDNDDDPLFD